MSHKLIFAKLHEYNPSESGITAPVRLSVGEKSVDISAKIDTGASFCIFQRGIGEALLLDIEKGIRQEIGTAAGSFTAYGHEVSLFILGLQFDATVYFAADYNFVRDVLGRRGWLDRLRIGIIDYDGKLYVSSYDDGNE